MTFYNIKEEQLEYLKKKDKKLKEVILKYGVIKREIEPDLFKALIYNIIGQQISTKAALIVRKKFLEIVGEINPQNVLNYSDEVIQKAGLSLRKVSYIKEISKRVVSNELDLNSLKDLKDEEVIKTLTKLPGIGVWTAEMVLLFTLGREDVMSYLDLAIIRGLKRLYNKDNISKEEFLEIKKSYSPYASVASLYIWKLASET